MDHSNTINNTTETHNPVNLTERAARQVQRIMEDESIPDNRWLRIAVKGGGCSGLSYVLDFDERTEDDELISTSGVDVIIDRHHIQYLGGITIDFHDGLDARGFVFNNPKATSTCGCGTSFSA